MAIIVALVSIFALTGFAYLARRFTPLKVCPICAGVSLTWAWMLTATLTGQLPITNYQLPIAILMGGSVAGIAYQLEKKLPAEKSPLLWKTLFIPVGFTAVWGVLTQTWRLAVLGILAAALLAFLFTRHRQSYEIRSRKNSYEIGSRKDSSRVEELEKKMEDCC